MEKMCAQKQQNYIVDPFHAAGFDSAHEERIPACCFEQILQHSGGFMQSAASVEHLQARGERHDTATAEGTKRIRGEHSGMNLSDRLVHMKDGLIQRLGYQITPF